MKTNHQRKFVANKPRDKRGSSFTPLLSTERIIDKTIGASIGWEFSNGNRGMAKAVRGAKKFVRSRTRFHLKTALRKTIETQE